MRTQKQKEKNNSRLNRHTSGDNIADKTQHFNVSHNNDNVQKGNPQIAKIKQGSESRQVKNKEIPKGLSMPPPNLIHPQLSSPNNSNFFFQNGIPIQEYYARCMTPIYTAGSIYMENMTYHPHFQYMNAMPFGGIYPNRQASVPNTPLAVTPHRMNASLVFSPPPNQSEPATPKYLQNVMQHPLLRQSFADSLHYREYMMRSALEKKKSDDNPEDRKFDPYITLDEAELGLKNNSLIEGFLRINPKQFQHAYVSSSDRNEQDIFIDGLKNRNRALEGDIIVVKLIEDSDTEERNENRDENETNKQKRGKVVFIKEKVHTRACIGNLKLMADKSRQKALFVPRDNRMPRLNIPFTCWPDNFYQDSKKYEDTVFLAQIEDWYDTRFAMGKIICNIGQSGDMETESKAILAQNNLSVTPYGPEVRGLYPRLDYTIPEDEILIREDCRKLCIFSIDPPNCRDIDDAVSCRKLANGNYEIGVHISDVAHYLTENTLLDEQVAEKATTIYMVERAYHMLPDDLCMLCSLFPGVDKLAFSVFWEINENAEVLNHRFSKTIIRSCAQLAYDHAQAILENKDDAKNIFPETYNAYEFEDMKKAILTLGKISAIMRKKRFDGGALKLNQPKVAFRLNANGLPETFWIYEQKESHQLIEEFMLLANMTVAHKIYKDYADLAFLRCHPPPSAFMMKQLIRSLKPMGIHIDISSPGALQKSLTHFENSGDKGKALVLTMLCAKPMARAKYLCAHGASDNDFHHYALNVPLYTHFTSPIRRYADIMVHRLLAASINFRQAPDWKVDKVSKVAAQCNKKKYDAKKAGEMSTEVYMLKYIELNSPLLVDAVVVDVRDKYIDTTIAALGLNRRIFFNSDFPGEYRCIKNEASARLSKMELTWYGPNNAKKKQIIEVFSSLKIELIKSDDNNIAKVETKLIYPQ